MGRLPIALSEEINGSPLTLVGQSGKYLRVAADEKSIELGTPAAGALPAGVILMWSGLLANIPSGWALCDGTLGTPDLRNKFIKGAAAAEEPGATGGALTHSHIGHSAHVVTQPSDHAALSHAGGAVDAHSGAGVDAHSAHSGGAVNTHVQQSGKDGTSGAAYNRLISPLAHTFTQAAAHAAHVFTQAAAHIFTQPSQHPALSHSGAAVDAHSAHDSPNHEPAYYKLAFIMKT